MWPERTIEFWVALLAAALYVFLNSKEKAVHYRILMVASSAGFGFSLAADFSDWLGIGETLSGVIITVFGYLFVDLATALLADRPFIKDFLKSRFK